MIFSIRSCVSTKYDQWVLTVFPQKMGEAFFKPIDQFEQKSPAEVLVNKGAQETHTYTAPAPNFDGYQSADFHLQPGSILFADVCTAGFGVISRIRGNLAKVGCLWLGVKECV